MLYPTYKGAWYNSDIKGEDEMKILGIDSSGMVASAAIVEDDILVAEYSVNFKKTHSETLLPMIDEIVRMTETELSDIDAIAVASGPGSFTGLRIGAATVKGLGLALDKPIVPVPTCEALAYNIWNFDGVVCPIMDARRSQVYTGVYDTHAFNVLMDQNASSLDDLIAYLDEHYAATDVTVCFTGDGVPVYKEKIDNSLRAKHIYAPAHINRQRAAAVATLGMVYFKEGKYESAAEHKPVYLRKSQAERERENKI
jgi:tRNA threonylcarbamoyl adenosine modification protein YeaZ